MNDIKLPQGSDYHGNGKYYTKKNTTNKLTLKIEMLDSFGNTVYVVPVDLVGEEVKPYLPYRYVTVEVYRPPVNREGLENATTASLSALLMSIS